MGLTNRHRLGVDPLDRSKYDAPGIAAENNPTANGQSGGLHGYFLI
jgi:hypothetical protein